MDADDDPRTEQAQRLMNARVRRGIGDAKKTALYFGWPYDTYIQHERGTRGLRVEVARKYAKALRVPASWLLTGEGDPGWSATSSVASGLLSIDKELLRQALLFVFRNEGVPEQRASLIADILPEALAGVPVDAVGGDPLLSFRVHYQLEAQRFARPERQ